MDVFIYIVKYNIYSRIKIAQGGPVTVLDTHVSFCDECHISVPAVG